IDELVREKDIINKNLVKATNATQKQVNLVKLHEKSKKNLEEEIQNYKNEAQKQRKIIYQLEKERDCYINEAGELKQKVGTPLGADSAQHFERLISICVKQ
uniref:Cilia- and flagella-associated protein 58 central coiled coil domain-containing protein n=1 Tax=Nothoprocta perdicaria TaxID=30464 RepID=A0A8C6ZRH0_NOTPE